MDKKEYIIQILETIRNDWAPAEWLLILAKEGMLSNGILDVLVEMLQTAIDETADEITKNKLIGAQTVFAQIKEAEAQSRVLDEQDISVLESEIANI